MIQKTLNLYRETQNTLLPSRMGPTMRGPIKVSYSTHINNETRTQRSTATHLKSQRNIENMDVLMMHLCSRIQGISLTLMLCINHSENWIFLIWIYSSLIHSFTKHLPDIYLAPLCFVWQQGFQNKKDIW